MSKDDLKSLRGSDDMKIRFSIKITQASRENQCEENKTPGKQQLQSETTAIKVPTTDFTCSKCQRVCHSRIGLISHSRRCQSSNN